jgi:hypothetical protein
MNASDLLVVLTCYILPLIVVIYIMRWIGKHGLENPFKRKKKEALTIAEKDDVKASLKEIKEGRSKKFKNVNDFLKELKEKEAQP